MKIAMIGTGYVGLVTGTCFAEFGFEVTCVDQAQSKIDTLKSGRSPIYEPGLETLITQNVNKNRLAFTTSLSEAVKNADVVCIAVGTPPDPETGRADLSYVFAAAEEIAQHLNSYTVVVTKSTVPIGTARKVADRIRSINPQADFDVVSNPEFLREGSAIEDFMRPNRVIIGCESDRAREVMHMLYRPLYLLETPSLYTNWETAELIKYASNAFLATKIGFINEMANLCEASGANVQDVSIGMGLDQRIGKKFLHAGPGFGGSCLPKDTLALVQTARDLNAPTHIVESVIRANEERKNYMTSKIMAACGENLANKKLAILGLTFKPNTDDMRESPSLEIIPALQKAGAKVVAFDPKGMEEAKKHFTNIDFASDAYSAMQGTDAVIILTEWNEFRGLDLKRIKSLLRTPLIIDLRNIYTVQEIEKHGFTYHSIGRPPAMAKESLRLSA
jgi:UDPglucose 6-dehydrogenase